jgi:hypothetical protein
VKQIIPATMTQGTTHRQPSVRMAQPICNEDEQYCFASSPVTVLQVDCVVCYLYAVFLFCWHTLVCSTNTFLKIKYLLLEVNVFFSWNIITYQSLYEIFYSIECICNTGLAIPSLLINLDC